jgi:hypothetical protein
VVLETESYSAMDKGERKLVQMTIENFPIESKLAYTQAEVNESIGAMNVVRVRVKNGDEPAQDLPQQALMMYQQIGKNISGVSVMSGDLEADACETPYISSSRCYSFDFSVSVMGMTSSGRVTSHSRIPVNGLVRMESESMAQETIAFGTKGATSQF